MPTSVWSARSELGVVESRDELDLAVESGCLEEAGQRWPFADHHEVETGALDGSAVARQHVEPFAVEEGHIRADQDEFMALQARFARGRLKATTRRFAQVADDDQLQCRAPVIPFDDCHVRSNRAAPET